MNRFPSHWMAAKKVGSVIVQLTLGRNLEEGYESMDYSAEVFDEPLVTSALFPPSDPPCVCLQVTECILGWRQLHHTAIPI